MGGYRGTLDALSKNSATTANTGGVGDVRRTDEN